MTGATDFTRKAGLTGLVFCAVDAAFLLMGNDLADAREPSGEVQVLVFAGGIAGLVAFVGMIKRHRGQRWRRWAGTLALVSLVLLFGGVPTIGAYVLIAALLLVEIGVAFGGILPLAAGLLVLSAFPLRYVSVLLATVAGLAGVAWQSWVLWREPLPRRKPRHDPAPV